MTTFERDTTVAPEKCLFCGGTGVIWMPARVEAGRIVDDHEYKCSCQIKSPNDEPDHDF